jgi:hypothetical protein
MQRELGMGGIETPRRVRALSLTDEEDTDRVPDFASNLARSLMDEVEEAPCSGVRIVDEEDETTRKGPRYVESLADELEPTLDRPRSQTVPLLERPESRSTGIPRLPFASVWPLRIPMGSPAERRRLARTAASAVLAICAIFMLFVAAVQLPQGARVPRILVPTARAAAPPIQGRALASRGPITSQPPRAVTVRHAARPAHGRSSNIIRVAPF